MLTGGGGEKVTFKLVAQYGDACNVLGDLETIKHKLAVLKEHCETVGRDYATIHCTTGTVCSIADSDEEALAYTPKHGSWLNMAEIEIAILQRNALSRRLESEEALCRQVSAVESERNAQLRGIVWQFTSRDARGILERLYPVKESSSG